MKKLALPNFGKIKINVSLLLTIVLFLVLLYEAYLAWQYIFKNLYSGEVSVAPSDIVRVDLNAYQDTLDYLDRQKKFQSPSVNVNRGNPFRP
ncbi:MAG: hypothetical protein A3H72_01605 [Candidatus Doudnabacteria bacterium RIFCSPLOWO2_02_FULL_48_8]|uniref:Uncharacterized protein n=1 Tax=Candidatus Doudnabacteria bacterium RIFCSPHIGHO2_01_FULL_46_24 TaxID=1817825 RepID=A0A1F5NTL6_9BACT|nr:MAG: hypothetical protein A2720_03875 [Candidatus Doudnabacteria bacterium RIFCSPHIGHO2_01_FULL_46_24]OGE94981.1 MAG: hypothetical protein A3H72_01605 [Candidatus Doudnabacteria bacterium RIFCSPLOWO2_02_FULL_48_8]OGE95881.1 MAG: hypothetical protein A3E98_03885 [Candidatus Doudnabacteria bacterium RIFCSPHIGHO2_12_FULL_48_11]